MSHGQSPYTIPAADPNNENTQASRDYLAAKQQNPEQHKPTRKLPGKPAPESKDAG